MLSSGCPSLYSTSRRTPSGTCKRGPGLNENVAAKGPPSPFPACPRPGYTQLKPKSKLSLDALARHSLPSHIATRLPLDHLPLSLARMRIELPIASFLCLGLLLLLSPVFLHSRNLAVISLAAWLVFCNLISGINAVVWAGNVHNHAPVWCDISTSRSRDAARTSLC